MGVPGRDWQSGVCCLAGLGVGVCECDDKGGVGECYLAVGGSDHY